MTETRPARAVMVAARLPITRERANEILRLWKYGLENFPPYVINSALFATGDLR